MATIEENKQSVEQLLSGLAEQVDILCGQLMAYVPAASIRDALLKLRDGELKFDILSSMTAADYHPREPRFEMVYELYSLENKCRVRVKCKLEDTGSEENLPEIDSVHDIYLTANWHERECYDLMGIHFKEHPDLRRIVLADGWDGHPLRKEYPYDGKRAWKLGCSVESAVQASENLGL
jgi:NADH-quinone oxidoreductase subunit C